MNYLITGGTGFVGSNLIKDLLANNQKLIVLTRNKKQASQILSDKVRLISDLEEIRPEEEIDYLINLAGEPIANKRWSNKQKEILIKSRLNITKKLIKLIARLNKKPVCLISASAIGYYGIDEYKEFDENSLPKNETDFTYRLCKSWEDQASEANKIRVKTYIIRLGVVIGKDGGILAKMLPIFKLGLGGKIGNGKQLMPWISIEDAILAINFIIQNQPLENIFNFVSLNPVSNADFTKEFAKILERPAFFNIPDFVIKIIFGEMGENLLLGSQKVKPTNLLKNNFKFKFTDFKKALGYQFNKDNEKS